ncbi:MAG TPA: hypothetical protein VNX15_07085 [Gemmatimonadales bacterium]|jgi:hypothetical protein|nr:hypothetical protein [Gemmatimonadales bacterium]
MARSLRLAIRVGFTLVAVLGLAIAPPLAAQQTVLQTPPARASATQADTGRAGPRVQADWRRREPTFADERAPRDLPSGDSHTFTISTIVLVLVVVIVVLLLVR